MYQKHELFGELSSVDITETLKACTLEQKDEYMEDEADRFRECRALIEQGKTYKQAAAQFRKQDKLKQTDNAQEDTNALEISELLALASEQVGTRISLIEAGKILAACGLPDKEEYTGVECDRFVEACTLAKQQDKTYQEIEVHFGVANDISDRPDRHQLSEEAQGSIQHFVSTQAVRTRQALAAMSRKHIEEAELQYLIALSRDLQDYEDSGQMQADFEANAKAVINEPLFDWSLTNNANTRALNGNRDRKSLPGS